MRVLCENCNQQYIINEDNLKAETSRFKCKKCSHFVIVTKSETESVGAEGDPAGNEIDFAGSVLDEIKEQADTGSGFWANLEDEQKEEEDFDINSWSDLNEEFDADTSADEDLAGNDEVKSDELTDRSEPTEPMEPTEPTVAGVPSSNKGMTIRTYMSLTFLLGFLFMTATIVFVNRQYVPALVNEQIDLRTSAISKSFSGAVKQPLLVRNYLWVNQEADRVSQLPGVAYASVINKRNVVVAGVLSRNSMFDPVFLDKVSRDGFPKELAGKNNLNNGETEKKSEFTIGGQPIYDVAVSLGDVGGEVHVGLFTADIQESVRKSIIPMLVAISVLFVLGMIGFSLLARFISKPLQDLTEIADRISKGEVDERIVPKGPREIRDLCRSLDRMRASVRAALKRLQ